LAALLEQHGFEVERGYAGMSTAFRATRRNFDEEAMRKGLRHGQIAYVAEYHSGDRSDGDHAHHLMSAAAVAAAVGLSAALETERGAVTVLGIPGGVRHGGKLALEKAVVFEEFDAVLGAHPAEPGLGYCDTISDTGDTLATATMQIVFSGPNQNEAARRHAAGLAGGDVLADSSDEVLVDDVSGAIVRLVLRGKTAGAVAALAGRITRRVQELADPAEVELGDCVNDTIVNRIVARRVKTWADTSRFKMDRIVKSPPGEPSSWGSISYSTPTCLVRYGLAGVESSAYGASVAELAGTPEAFDRTMRMATCLCLAGIDLVTSMEFRSIADDQLVKALRARGVERKHRRWLGVHPVMPAKETEQRARGPKMTEFKWVRGPGITDN
jgi:hypothetical protein